MVSKYGRQRGGTFVHNDIAYSPLGKNIKLIATMPADLKFDKSQGILIEKNK